MDLNTIVFLIGLVFLTAVLGFACFLVIYHENKEAKARDKKIIIP